MWILEKERKHFETNSSSSHSLVVSVSEKNKGTILKEKREIKTEWNVFLNFEKTDKNLLSLIDFLSYKALKSEFGWGFDVVEDSYSKLLYIILYLCKEINSTLRSDIDKILNIFNKVLKELFDLEIDKLDLESIDLYKIEEQYSVEFDHNTVYDTKQFLRIFQSKDTLENFLFSEDSIAIIQNDNDRDLELSEKFQQKILKRKIPGNTIYFNDEIIKIDNEEIYFHYTFNFQEHEVEDFFKKYNIFFTKKEKIKINLNKTLFYKKLNEFFEKIKNRSKIKINPQTWFRVDDIENFPILKKSDLIELMKIIENSSLPFFILNGIFRSKSIKNKLSALITKNMVILINENQPMVNLIFDLKRNIFFIKDDIKDHYMEEKNNILFTLYFAELIETKKLSELDEDEERVILLALLFLNPSFDSVLELFKKVSSKVNQEEKKEFFNDIAYANLMKIKDLQTYFDINIKAVVYDSNFKLDAEYGFLFDVDKIQLFKNYKKISKIIKQNITEIFK